MFQKQSLPQLKKLLTPKQNFIYRFDSAEVIMLVTATVTDQQLFTVVIIG